jgi:hypothetical protein
LASALIVRPAPDDPQEPYRNVTLSVDQLKLKDLTAGFLSCQVQFFNHDPNDHEAVELLLYGQH